MPTAEAEEHCSAPPWRRSMADRSRELESLSRTCIRQHTSAYVRWLIGRANSSRSLARQHTSAYVSIRQHTSAYVSIRSLAHQRLQRRQEPLGAHVALSSKVAHAAAHSHAYVSIHQHTSAYAHLHTATHALTPPPTPPHPPPPPCAALPGGTCAKWRAQQGCVSICTLY
jgi:hypothetical protein